MTAIMTVPTLPEMPRDLRNLLMTASQSGRTGGGRLADLIQRASSGERVPGHHLLESTHQGEYLCAAYTPAPARVPAPTAARTPARHDERPRHDTSLR